MEPNFSKSAFLKFLKFVEDKGLVSGSMAQGWRVAAAKILDDITDAEDQDIRRIDVEAAFRRFSNKNGGQYTPKTLAEYRKRTVAAIENFTAWASAPESYKPKFRERARGSSGERRSAVARPSGEAEDQEVGNPPSEVATTLVFPYPLRQDFLVRLVLPRDLTQAEARRLGAFLLTVATDFRPSASESATA